MVDLQYELDRERLRRKALEETTVKEQMHVLEQLDRLERRFVEVEAEKEALQRTVVRQ